ncbi:MAG TPA: YdcF family protein [Aeromicrobium sp.]|nr:YdcF family protein [Aeromicrobium sp.]
MRGASIFWFIFSSGGILVSLLTGVLWLYARPRSRWPRAFLAVIAIAYTLASVYAVPHLFAGWLADGFRPLTSADVPPGRSVVVLLGSGSYRRSDWANASYSVLDPIGAERTLEAARVFRLIHPELVISSGGSIDPDEPEDPSGDTMKELLLRLGIPDEKIIVERESRNTRDEATAIAAMLPTLGADHVVLVTSPIHMRRSMGMFRAVGITAIPAIARDPEYSSWTVTLLPSQTGLRLTSLVVHEALGLLYYRLRGWYV